MDKGILYFLISSEEDKEKVISTHLPYAIESVKSIKKVADVPCILYTNIHEIKSGFDEIKYTNEVKDVWVYKYECLLNSPFDQTLHLDCDTYIAEDFTHVFNMLERFDLVLPLSPWYWSNIPLGIDKCFPEFAGGFMLYNKSDKIKKLFEDIKIELEHRSKGCDEPYLRKVLYYSDVRFSVVPWEYTCVFSLPGYLCKTVKIFHGKYKDIDKVIKAINSKVAARIYTGERLLILKKSKYKQYSGIEKEIKYD